MGKDVTDFKVCVLQKRDGVCRLTPPYYWLACLLTQPITLVYTLHTVHTQVGDRVLCGEPRCFANRLNAPARRVCPLQDDSISFEDAASIQVRPTRGGWLLISVWV